MSHGFCDSLRGKDVMTRVSCACGAESFECELDAPNRNARRPTALASAER
jgi:hypothetical protein